MNFFEETQNKYADLAIDYLCRYIERDINNSILKNTQKNKKLKQLSNIKKLFIKEKLTLYESIKLISEL